MASILTPSYVTGISGKVCSHEANEYRTNSSSGKITLSKKCNPFKGEATAKQKAVRAAFKSRVAVVREWLSVNRPTKTNVKGTALYQEAMKLKKLFMLDNIQALLSEYQGRVSPWTIKLPSEGGERVKKGDDVVSGSDSGSQGSGGGSQSSGGSSQSGGQGSGGSGNLQDGE